ncbi:MAG: proliferating cell nuclear antigen (pcna) [Candidatus Aenigmatarchaeota archaeon]
MFNARLDDIFLLRESMAVVSDLIDETELHIKRDGIEMIATDRAVVAVVDFFLSADAFKDYIYEKDLKLGINLLNFMQILKRAQADDILKMKIVENKLQVIFERDSEQTPFTRSFDIPLIDVSKEDIPDLTKLEAGFSASLTIDSEVMNSGIDDAELIADSIVFTVRKDLLMMKATSDSSTTQLELPTGSDILKINEINEPVRARYSLDYLKKIFKARKLSKEAKIFMSTDYPMKVQFEVTDKLKLGFILAPRIEE